MSFRLSPHTDDPTQIIMYHHSLFTAISLCLAGTSFASADQARQGVIVTLNSIGDRVRSQNPDLGAARLRIDEAMGRHVQSGRLSNPELNIDLSHDRRFRERGAEVGFSQRFPITNRLMIEKKITAIELKAAEAEVREVERGIIAEAKQGVVKVLAIRQRRTLVERQIELSNDFSTFLGEAAKKGEGSPLDAGQARIEAASLALEQRQLAASEVAEIGALKPFLGVRPGELLYVSGELPEPVVPKADADPGKRPDYQAAILNADAARQSIELEKTKKYDDVQAGFFAGLNREEDAPEGYDTEGVVGLRLTIPLPLWNKNEGGVMEARARTERLEKEASALNRSIRLEADAAKAEMEEWAKLLSEVGGDLLPQAEEQANAAEDAFRKGQGEIQTVFRAREKRIHLASARLDALREFHLARVRYEAASAKP